MEADAKPPAKIEVMFYHLMEQPVEIALTGLLERSLQRGWRVIVQGNDRGRLEALDQHLWMYKGDSFLPHALDNGEAQESQNAERQPVWLTEKDASPNGAQVRFLIDRAEATQDADHERLVYMFDGLDMEAVGHARERWKAEKALGRKLTYWQQSPEGRWEKKAEA
ncbi:MAG: DNA polymerase III subunit chi [Pseudomonadota bacterium]